MHYAMLIESKEPFAPEKLEALMHSFNYDENENCERELCDSWSAVLNSSDDKPNPRLGTDIPENYKPYYFLNAEGKLYADGIDWSRYGELQKNISLPAYNALSKTEQRKLDEASRRSLETFQKICQSEFFHNYKIKDDMYYTFVDIHD